MSKETRKAEKRAEQTGQAPRVTELSDKDLEQVVGGARVQNAVGEILRSTSGHVDSSSAYSYYLKNKSA